MNPHLQPWSLSADDYPDDSFTTDQLEFLLGYAVLAPSTHNTQPWQFQLHSMHADLFADRRRALRVVDPYDRELTISCGAALFNMRVAAEYFGHQYRVDVLPEKNEPNLLARFHLGLKCETTSEDVLLFHAITKRHTNRGPFRPDPVPEQLLESLEEAVRNEGVWMLVAQGDEARAALASLIAEGDRTQWANKRFREELARWMRTKTEQHRDGIPVHDVGIKDWMAFAGPALVRTFDRGSGQAARDADIALHSPLLVVLGTEGETPAEWLQVGQALQSLLLRASAEDVWASFLNQPIEVPELRARLTETLGCPGVPHLVLRLGYGKAAEPTPRRAVHEVVIRLKTGHAT